MQVWGLMLLRSKLFYCLRLPIQSNARGGDQNASLEFNIQSKPLMLLLHHGMPIVNILNHSIPVVLGDASLQQTLLLSLAPHPTHCV